MDSMIMGAPSMINIPSNPAAAPVTQTPPPAAINPLLLTSACSGYMKGLDILLNSQGAAGDEELPFDLQAAYVSSDSVQLTPEALLKGVTVEGDTALHAVATNGDCDNFLLCADLICSKAEHDILFVQNKRGDTALHLAARAGKSQMVIRLMALASKSIIGVNHPTTTTIDASARLKRLLRMRNKLNKTVLHEAVRTGCDHTVELLMKDDPALARSPEKDTAPLYLATSLGNKTITETLYGKSGRILSYSGPNKQNALHVAVSRGDPGQFSQLHIPISSPIPHVYISPLQWRSSGCLLPFDSILAVVPALEAGGNKCPYIGKIDGSSHTRCVLDLVAES